MDDLFRSFFNFPRRRDNSGRGMHENDSNLFGSDEMDDNFPSTFSVFFPHDIFKHMDEMMKNMEQMMEDGQQSGLLGFPDTDRGRSYESPRDQMLKDEDERSQLTPPSRLPGVWGMERFNDNRSREDRDLDSLVQSPGSLDRILSPENENSVSPRNENSVRAFNSTGIQTRISRDTEGNTERVTKHTKNGHTCTERQIKDRTGRVIEEWTDCSKDMMKNSPNIIDSGTGHISIRSSLNSDDQSVFSSIFGSDSDSNR